MADKKPYLVVNYDAMTFTVNDAEKPTAQDEADIARFLRAGFKMRHKSAKRTNNATQNAKKDEDILAELKKDEKNPLALVKYLFVKTDKRKDAEGKRIGGFFKAKAWYEQYKAGNWTPDEKETKELEGKKQELLDDLKKKEEEAKKAEAEAKKAEAKK